MNSPGTILLVDDEPQANELMALTLRQDGYRVSEVGSGAAALALYPEIEPDLVILDVGMPEMDGLETCRRLIATHGDACAPVVFHTARFEAAEIAAGFEAGAVDYLTKPAPLKEIRARVRAHVENHALAKEQTLLLEKLRHAHEAKNRFIGMAAHDMRNPLASIRGFAEFLLDGTMGPMTTQQLGVVSIIHGTSNLMLKTVNELLDAATIEAGKLKLHRAPHDLTELLAKAVAQAAIAARRKRTRLAFERPAGAIVLPLDADKVRQVIGNMLENAIRFSPAGSTISVALELGRDTPTCRFVVRDCGPGMAAEHREKLFSRVTSLDRPPGAQEKNSGLGLLICRNIVEAHGGRIGVENLAEGGCEFAVTLPLDGSP